MCLICIELTKQRMTPPEAMRAAREYVEMGVREHYQELLEALEKWDVETLERLLNEIDETR